MDLREVASSDAHSLFALISDDPKVEQYISPPPPSEGAFAGFIDWAQRERAGKGVCFAVVPHGLEQAVGLFQVRALEPTFFTAEWGFALGSSFWSTGIFEEAATLVADFTFDVLGAFRIEGRAATVNARGNGALTKIGAISEAILKNALGRDGTWHEQLLWTLVANLAQRTGVANAFPRQSPAENSGGRPGVPGTTGRNGAAEATGWRPALPVLHQRASTTVVRLVRRGSSQRSFFVTTIQTPVSRRRERPERPHRHRDLAR